MKFAEIRINYDSVPKTREEAFNPSTHNFRVLSLEEIVYNPDFRYVNLDNFQDISNILKENPDITTNKQLQKILL